MKKRRAILHIGTEKTGTTRIQFALASARSALLDQGFSYPLTPGTANHVNLAIYSGHPDLVKDLAHDFNKSDDISAINKSFEIDFDAEISSLPDEIHTVIFSNEHCHSRLRDTDSIARLKSLMDKYFYEYKIIVYLRRQDHLAISHYTTALRNGATYTEVLPPPWREPPSFYDYEALLERWSACFGKNAIVPRLFDRGRFLGGDVLLDFLDFCKLDIKIDPQEAGASNVSLRPVAQEFLRRFNMSMSKQGDPHRPGLGLVGRLLDMHFAGPGSTPRRDKARAFLSLFMAGNENVRREWFPDEAVLFSDDVDEYPDETSAEITEAEMLDVAITIIRSLDKVLNKTP